MRRLQDRMLKKMGLAMEELSDVDKVIILTSSKRIEILNPTVTKFVLQQGQDIYQVIGTTKIEEIEEVEEIEIPEEDIMLVSQQVGCDYETAKKALESTGGDIAQAILLLKRRPV